MKENARYVKIIEWSFEDHCFVGSAPGLFYVDATVVMKNRFFQNYVKWLTKPLN